jgi:hypothetical protein
MRPAMMKNAAAIATGRLRTTSCRRNLSTAAHREHDEREAEDQRGQQQ